MVASSLRAISLGLSVLPAFAGNASLRGLASAEGSSRGSTLPSWCNNIPSNSWSEIPDCGGTTNAGSSTGGMHSWCANIPAEAMVVACAQQQSANLKDVQAGGVQLKASQLPITREINVPAALPGVTPAVHVPAVDPNAIIQGETSNVADPNAIVGGITSSVQVPTVGARSSVQNSMDMDLQASQLPVAPGVNVPAIVPGVTPAVRVPAVDPNAIIQGVTSDVADPNSIVRGIISSVPVPTVGASVSEQNSMDTDLQAAQLPVAPAVNVPAVVPGLTPAVHVPAVDPNGIVQGVTSNVADPNAIAREVTSSVPVPTVGASLSGQDSKDMEWQAAQLPVAPGVNVPVVVPGLTPAVHVPALDPNAIVQGVTSNVADPNAVVRGVTSSVPVPAVGASLSDQNSKDMDLQAAQLPVATGVNVPAAVPGVTPAVHVPASDPNAIVQGATSNVADPNAIVHGIISSVPVPTVGASLSAQKRADTETKSTVEQGLSPKQAVDNALIGSSSSPAWCNDIPSAGQQYIAACGGSADGNGQSSTGGGTPSWCENIPAASRADIPSCANQENAPLSAAHRLVGSSSLLLALSGILSGTVAYA